ncbi:MAG: DUF58 domain-containing protein [Polyangiaceae bacterium]|nr:DUF58 domain-containing protein [Polyangiaceae bacterium]
MGLRALIRRVSLPPPSVRGEQDLFDDEFQRKLEYLAIVSRRVFAGKMRAERRTRKSGSGIEFADHRDYVAGDDFRYLDWNVYQRFGRLLLRLFEEEEDLSVYIIVDASSSMGFGGNKKIVYAKRLAASLAYIGLANLDRVALVTTTDRVLRHMPATRGKQRIFKVFQFLRETRADGTTDLGQALRVFVSQHKRRGLAVLISDLYDPAGFEHGINALRYAKFEPFVIHLIDHADASPPLRGDVRIYDCETGEEREVTITTKVLAKYRETHESYIKDIQAFCTAKQVPYVPGDVKVPFDEMVLRVLRRGGIVG